MLPARTYRPVRAGVLDLGLIGRLSEGETL